MDDNTRPADVRRHYSVDTYEVEFLFDHIGAIRHVSSRVGLRAVSAEVRYYFAGHAPDDGHQASAPPDVAVSEGGALERMNVSPIGAFDMFFRLDKVLTPTDSEAHVIEYQVSLPDEHRADPVIMYFTPVGAKCHQVTVRFEQPALPQQIWSFAAPDAYQADHPEPDAELVLSVDGRYVVAFDELIAGWCYGLTWRWREVGA